MDVPFLDLQAHHRPLREELEAAVRKVGETSAFSGGRFVEQFEEEFARYCGRRYAAGVGSGTDALWLILTALGIGEGDEVITVPNSFIATAEAISRCGARPVFVDVDGRFHTMNPTLLEEAITERTRGVIPVHLFGQTADMDPLRDIARRYGLYLIEDACQAHGAEYRGDKAGSLGHAGAFSFYPGKNLGAWGEAGAVVTDDRELADMVKALRDHGQNKKYLHRVVGWNARMDGIQAAVLSVKLKHLDGWNRARGEIAEAYCAGFREIEGVSIPREAEYARHVYHVYAVQVHERDRVRAALAERGVQC
ncbi:MAG: DegT/DnrJ/EryC1/StrS family aminotransferase, partial [Spirochaetota bacterium]